jgi:hypothetical protein
VGMFTKVGGLREREGGRCARVENVRKRKCVYEREKEVHGSGACVSFLRLMCVELRLSGVS